MEKDKVSQGRWAADPDDFQALIRQYGKDVWSYIFFLTKSSHTADHISQEAFVRAYTKLNTFQGEISLKIWLFTITRNLVMTHKRSAFIQKVTLVNFFHYEHEQKSAEERCLQAMNIRGFWKLVFRLPDKYREVLVLETQYELLVEEIAKLLGVSERTIKSRLNTARKLLNQGTKEVESMKQPNAIRYEQIKPEPFELNGFSDTHMQNIEERITRISDRQQASDDSKKQLGPMLLGAAMVLVLLLLFIFSNISY